MKALLTELTDRILRFDGVSIIEPTRVEEFLLKGSSSSALRVIALNPEVQVFNDLVSDKDKIKLNNDESLTFKYDWLLPDKYLHLDI
jgi:hypothetical protein